MATIHSQDIQYQLDLVERQILEEGEQAIIHEGGPNIHQLEFPVNTTFLDLVVNNYNNKERTYGMYELENFNERLFRRDVYPV